MASKLPKLVLHLTHAHNGWIVGSGADPNLKEPPRDYDVVIPFSEWQQACMLIPSDAVPNTFGGWKCLSDGFEVDVWPAELSWLMQRPQMKFIWHVASGIRWTKI
jgi:hypothetical protein